MKTITFFNEKGGVGKSTISSSVAVGLARRGHRVLFIDSDPQANGSSALNVAKSSAFFNLLIKNTDWRAVIKRVSPGVLGADIEESDLYCVPSSYQTAGIPHHPDFRGSMLRPRMLQLAQAKLFDYCIIDTQPIPNRVHEAILSSTDYVLLVTTPESFSAWEGVPQSFAHMQKIHEDGLAYNIDVANIAGIIPNMYRDKTALHMGFIADLHKTYGDLVWSPIHLAVAFGKAQSFKHSIYKESAATAQRFIEPIVDKVEALGYVGKA